MSAANMRRKVSMQTFALVVTELEQLKISKDENGLRVRSSAHSLFIFMLLPG